MPITRSAEMPSPPQPVRRTAPTSTATKAAMAKAQAESEAKTQRRVDALNSIGSIGHMILLGFKLPADAAAVNRHTPPLSAAIVEYSETMDSTGWIDKLSDVSPIAGIVAAAAPLVLQVCVNHNLFGMKAEQLASAGVVTKETLVAETNTYLMGIQTQAMQAQMLAEQELRQTHAEYTSMMRERESDAE